MGALYIVATPIGNLEDITLRSLRVLREVGLIAAEDTRTTRKLLNRYDIKVPLTSYHEHNRTRKIPLLLEALKTTDVALVSEAGMPVISDSGYELVAAAIEGDVQVIPVPGASAVTASLVASGLPSDEFLFLGFLPRRARERRRLLESIRTQTCTVVVFEAPHRFHESLQDALDVIGDRRIAVCRELTKLHEEVFRGTVSEAIAHFAEPRGEMTLVIAGAAAADLVKDLDGAREELRRLKGQEIKAKEAVGAVAAATGISKREVYKLWLGI